MSTKELTGQAVCDIGVVGLGVMGQSLAANLADHGFAVEGYDRDADKLALAEAELGDAIVAVCDNLPRFIELLRAPRIVLMMVPAGPPVDAVIQALLSFLAPGDVIIDGGNSHFRDTDVRGAMLAGKGIQYLGVGISGGAHGARHGASLMVGGPQEAYQRVRPMLAALAAEAHGEPCLGYFGPGSAGHYVKMVHNGIEYALMQLIAEAYHVMRQGMGLTDNQLQAIFEQWNRGELNGYLMEITARIFAQSDDRTSQRLVDVILDEAHQKGTGKWTSQEAMELGVPTPTIDAAVAMRNLSALKRQREVANGLLGGKRQRLMFEAPAHLPTLADALYAAMIVAYAQGMTLLRRASEEYGYGLDLAEVARIWRGGCIIRSAVVEDIRKAFAAQPQLSNLLLDLHLGQAVMSREKDVRWVVERAVGSAIPVPATAASLAYFDAYRSAWLPANLIEAQRDYFGAHGYERVDVRGVFHTQWRGA